MASSRPDVERTISGFLRRANKGDQRLDPDKSLYAEGIGLDSLETAELSAVLEDEFGTDPFSDGADPQTIGDVVAYYVSDDAGSASAAS